MDKETKKLVITIGAILTGVVVVYYLISPLQNCLRDNGRDAGACYRLAKW